MPTGHDVTLKSANCLAKQLEFGVTKIHNICTGTISDVPWGSADWALALSLIGFFGLLALMFGAMAFVLIRD